MRFLRDDALLRRAIGAALLLGLLGWWARHWRETTLSDSYDAANNLMHTCWTLAVVAVVYVAASLLLTPLTTATEAESDKTAAPSGPVRP